MPAKKATPERLDLPALQGKLARLVRQVEKVTGEIRGFLAQPVRRAPPAPKASKAPKVKPDKPAPKVKRAPKAPKGRKA